MSNGEMQPRSIEDILYCSRPLLFESGVEEYPYCWGGSAFVIEHSNRIFAITARHCITGVSAGAIFVQDRRDSLRGLPISVVSSGEGDMYGDPGYSDIAVLAVNMSIIPDDEIEHVKSYALRDFSAIPDSDWPLGKLVYRGFLKQDFADRRNGIDIDEKRIDWVPLAGEAVYTGLSEVGEHVRKLAFQNLPQEVTSIDGLSGSPVFHIMPIADGNQVCRLAGVIIRGNAESAIGHFIEDKVIYTVLHQLINRKP